MARINIKLERWEDREFLGLPIVREFPTFNRVSVEVAEDQVESILASLATLPGVIVAEKVGRSQLDLVSSIPAPNDNYINKIPALFDMKVLEAHQYTKGENIPLAIIDSGVWTGHPDFAGQTFELYSFDFIDATTTRPADQPIYTHGTSTAGCIFAGANNAEGGMGVAPNLSRKMIYRINAADMIEGDDIYSGNDDEIADALRDAVDRGAKVISMSISSNRNFTFYDEVMQYIVDNGAQLIQSAGNTYINEIRYPYHADALKVAATQVNEAASDFTTWGDHIYLAAYGVSSLTPSFRGSYPDYTTIATSPKVRVPDSPSYYETHAGTSFSTPYTAGVFALVWSMNPNLTASQVRQIIKETGDIPRDQITRTTLLPNAVRPNALRGVLAAKATLNAGKSYPYLGFFGSGFKQSVSAGELKITLDGKVDVEIESVGETADLLELWHGETPIYKGAPKKRTLDTNYDPRTPIVIENAADLATNVTLKTVVTNTDGYDLTGVSYTATMAVDEAKTLNGKNSVRFDMTKPTDTVVWVHAEFQVDADQFNTFGVSLFTDNYSKLEVNVGSADYWGENRFTPNVQHVDRRLDITDYRAAVKTTPDGQGRYLSGQWLHPVVNLSDYTGVVPVLISFWSTWAGTSGTFWIADAWKSKKKGFNTGLSYDASLHTGSVRAIARKGDAVEVFDYFDSTNSPCYPVCSIPSGKVVTGTEPIHFTKGFKDPATSTIKYRFGIDAFQSYDPLNPPTAQPATLEWYETDGVTTTSTFSATFKDGESSLLKQNATGTWDAVGIKQKAGSTWGPVIRKHNPGNGWV